MKKSKPVDEMATFQLRPRLDDATVALFDAYGARFGEAERKLNRLMDLGADILETKRGFIRGGLTARQFNSLRISVEGKRASLAECRKLEIADKKRRIAVIKKHLAKDEYTSFEAYQKKRRMARLEADVEHLEKTSPSLVFGGRKLWNAQHDIEGNGYASHEEWLLAWQKARSGGFFFVGSKDESFGNQSCQYNPVTRTLDVRLPNDLGGRIRIKDVSFAYGQKEIEESILADRAVSYRFVRKEKGWYLFASTARTPVKTVTDIAFGAIGVDIGPASITVVETDASGNPVWRKTIRLNLVRKTKAQVKATLEEAAIEVVDRAEKTGISVVLEDLDFAAKKAELRERGKGYARMLSGFAYEKEILAIRSRAAKRGVGVVRRNPAYTSIIGVFKFGAMYGMSADESAALAIARRGMNLRETVPAGTAFRRPEDRRKHVWSLWNRLGKALRPLGRHAFAAAKRGPGGGRRIYPVLPARASPAGRADGHALGKSLGLRVGVPAQIAGRTVGPAWHGIKRHAF
jgi:IS605 OrfB family transposase